MSFPQRLAAAFALALAGSSAAADGHYFLGQVYTGLSVPDGGTVLIGGLKTRAPESAMELRK